MNRLLTLFLALSLVFIVVVDVDAHIDTPHARIVSPHRMIKKRGLVGSVIAPAPPENVAASPGDSDTDPDSNSVITATGARSSLATTPTLTPGVTITRTQSTAAASSTGDPLGGILGPILGSTTSAARPNATSVALVNSTVSSSTPTSSIISTTSSSTLASTTLSSSTGSPSPIITTVTSPLAAQTSPPAAPLNSTTKIGRNTIIILAAIGGSIAAAGVIWTIIRKWKFRPSSSFDDRMQPIDWQPTHDDRDITEKLNRTASVRSHGSFTSGNGHNNGHGAGAGGDGLIADLPPLDYPAHLAPIGGYADLHRGASPQPGLGPEYMQYPVRAASPYQYDIPNPHPTGPAPAPGPAQYYGGGPSGGAMGYQTHGQGGYEQYPQQGGYEQRGY